MPSPRFVLLTPIRATTDLTRYRIDQVGARAAEKNRVEELFEDARQTGLSVVAGDIFAVSGRAMMAPPNRGILQEQLHVMGG